MAKFPEPAPADVLAGIAPELRELPAGSLIWRIYYRGGRFPGAWDRFRTFGPTNARFDHHLPDGAGRPGARERSILYSAESGVTCLAEVFQDTRTIDRRRASPWLVGFVTVGGLTLLDLTGDWPTRAGASQVIQSGPRPRARRWAQAIYRAYPDLDGLWYRSSMHGGRPAQALTDRAAARGCLPVAPAFHRALDDAGLLAPLRNAAAGLGYALI